MSGMDYFLKLDGGAPNFARNVLAKCAEEQKPVAMAISVMDSGDWDNRFLALSNRKSR